MIMRRCSLPEAQEVSFTESTAVTFSECGQDYYIE